MLLSPRCGARLTTLLLVVTLSLPLLHTAGAQATPNTAELERDFHALINVERAKEGVGALTVRSDLVQVARGHTDTMAAQWRLFHNPEFSSQITGWQRVSENVGYGPSVGAIHRALMNSEGHRRNILDDRVTEVGIGVAVKDGRVWVTQNFRRPSTNLTYSAPSTLRYGDVASTSVHASSIERVSVQGIVNSCGTARYCPDGAVSRGEFAEMLVRALELPAPATNTSRFTDVAGDTAAAVEALAVAGLTVGCGTDRFCPQRSLTREQQATFFANALGLAPRPTSFTDVGWIHSGSVGALQHAGIVNGCTPATFCPTAHVTRAQTASMIANHLS